MKKPISGSAFDRKIRVWFWILAAGWTLVVVVLAITDVFHHDDMQRAMAMKEAVANFNKDQAIRQWAAGHGGVYVPPSETTPPNPFLASIPERDIQTPSGKKLTLMNPAYMLRQTMEFLESSV